MLKNKKNEVKDEEKIKEVKNEYELQSLSPREDLDCEVHKFIQKVLEKEENRNIAIAGPYSSGKSSVINSYLKKYKKNNNLKTVTISLAKLLYEDKVNIETIEKNIIDKLHYSTKEKINWIKIWFALGLCVLSTILIIGIRFEKVAYNWEHRNHVIWLRGVPGFLLGLIGSYSLISAIIKIVKIKLKTPEVEMELDVQESNKSNLLNSNIKQIIKSLKNNNCIIFEDLDRFDNLEVFDHLRDLNITLNSTMGKKIIFIYEMREDIFSAENKSKFFDVVIPIVPFVSYENSGEEMLKIIENSEYNGRFSDQFILDICLYVKDIRILKNTFNEFCVYVKELGSSLPSYEKLFTILLYKNLFPNDYMLLQESKGIMYKYITKKEHYINKLKDKIKNEIMDVDEKLDIKKNNGYSYESIKKIFLTDLVEESRTKTVMLISGNTNKNITNYSRIEDIPDETFDEESEIKIGNVTRKTIEYIEEKDLELYELIKQQKISTENTISSLVKKREQLVKDSNLLDILTLKDIIKDNNDFFDDFPKIEEIKKDNEDKNKEFSNEIYNKFFRFIIREGYIDENYKTYLNRFKEGSLTVDGYNFIINLHDGNYLGLEYKFGTSANILKNIKQDEYRKEAILNIYVLNELLKKGNKNIDIFLDTLINSDNYVEFVDTFLENNECENKEKFIQKLFLKDSRIYDSIKIFKNSDYIVSQILEQNSVEKIKRREGYNMLEKYISETPLINFNITEDNKAKILDLNIKYKDLSKIKSELEDFYNFIVSNDCYYINHANIAFILKNRNINVEDIKNKNIESIISQEDIKKYVFKNFSSYIKIIYVQLKNQSDSEKTILEVLNSSDLSINDKKLYLTNQTNIITDIKNVENTNLWEYIVINSKVLATYENIYNYYIEFGLDEKIIEFINRNNEILSVTNFENLEFLKKVSLTDKISLNVFKSIISKVGTYTIEEFNEIFQVSDNKKKLKLLIEFGLIEKSIDSFMSLSELDIELALLFIENNKTFIAKNIDKITLNIDQIKAITNSSLTQYIKEQSIKQIKNIDLEKIEEKMDCTFAKNIVNIQEKNNEIIFSGEVVKCIFYELKEVKDKLSLINMNFKNLSFQVIKALFDLLGGEYAKILKNRARPKFKYDKNLIEILNKLKGIHYNIDYNVDINNTTIKICGTQR